MIDDPDRAASDFHHRLCRLARLLRATPVVVACALRDEEPPTISGLLAELVRLGTAWLRLDALNADDVAEILAARGEDGSRSTSRERAFAARATRPSWASC